MKQCQHPDGGFGGGIGQIAHLATTYASVNTVAILGPQAYPLINLEKLSQFLHEYSYPDQG